MVDEPAATILASLGATCTTVAFVPQIQKILKTGGKGVSYPILTLYLMGVSLWLGYGLAGRRGTIEFGECGFNLNLWALAYG